MCSVVLSCSFWGALVIMGFLLHGDIVSLYEKKLTNRPLKNQQTNIVSIRYVRGDVHENRAACLLSLLKPYLRILRGLSKLNLPGYVGLCQFLRHLRCQNAFEQAEMILPAA